MGKVGGGVSFEIKSEKGWGKRGVVMRMVDGAEGPLKEWMVMRRRNSDRRVRRGGRGLMNCYKRG